MYKRPSNSTRRWVIDGILLIGIVILYWMWVPLDLSSQACDLAQNAAWISVDWTSQPVDEDAVAQLATLASVQQLRYLYSYLTYVKPDGTFSQSYAHAAEFVAAFRRTNRETRLLAWVRIPIKTTAGRLPVVNQVHEKQKVDRLCILSCSLPL